MAVGRRRWLFIGHPEAGWRSAVIYSIIVSCRRRGINPQDYLSNYAVGNADTHRRPWDSLSTPLITRRSSATAGWLKPSISIDHGEESRRK